jgi:hypothetical protein
MIDVMHLKSFVIDENICEGGQQSLSSCKTRTIVRTKISLSLSFGDRSTSSHIQSQEPREPSL